MGTSFEGMDYSGQPRLSLELPPTATLGALKRAVSRETGGDLCPSLQVRRCARVCGARALCVGRGGSCPSLQVAACVGWGEGGVYV